MKNYVTIIGKYLCLTLSLLSISQIVWADKPYILIDKPSFVLYVIEGSDTVFKAPVSLGKNYGTKQRKGDHKTPEGSFYISQIQNSKTWVHDFKDGKGKVKGAYGPWFMRLKVPGWTSIGIHGTCFPESIGTRASEGCIRLRNEDLIILKQLATKGMRVIITPDSITQ